MAGVDESYRTLLTDNHSGSSEILKQTVEWIRESVQEDRNASEILQDLGSICRAHPAMALLHNLAAALSNTTSLSLERVDLWMQAYQEHEAMACREFSHLLSGFSAL